MNADVTPMNADKGRDNDGMEMDVEILANVTVPAQHFRFALSAFIGVTSAFIGVSKTLARVTQ